jgi:mono/diheme cytochrome c family protein
MKHRFVSALALLSLGSCNKGDNGAAARAELAANEFAQTLRARLQAAMAQGGPVNAVSVCSEQAPAVAREVSSRHHVAIGRASLRARNASNSGPAWVQQWLSAQGERAAQGLSPVRSREGDTVRLLRPLAVEGVCVTCHGARDAMPPALREALSARYPSDRAVDYRAGDLRGALWVEAPVR